MFGGGPDPIDHLSPSKSATAAYNSLYSTTTTALYIDFCWSERIMLPVLITIVNLRGILIMLYKNRILTILNKHDGTPIAGCLSRLMQRVPLDQWFPIGGQR